MAFVERTGAPVAIPTPTDLNNPGFELPIWVNVTAKVGEGVRNLRRTDTLWVQFIIRKIFDAPGMSKLPKPLKIDGIYGDGTRDWIAHFQTNAKAIELAQGNTAPPPRLADGSVSRVPPGSFLMRSTFSAYRLNKVLARLNPLLWVRLSNAATSNATLEAFIAANQ